MGLFGRALCKAALYEVPENYSEWAERGSKKMNLIKVSAELELTVHEFPEGSYKEQNKILRHLIGNGCSIYDHVMPKRLYTELHMKNCPTGVPGQCVSVLVDEEGRMKKDMGINLIASYLYETDKHRMPIVGNVLFVGEKYTGSGIDFCGIDGEVFKVLKERLDNMRQMAVIMKRIQGGGIR